MSTAHENCPPSPPQANNPVPTSDRSTDPDITASRIDGGAERTRPVRALSAQFAAVVRWLHIYVSLLGFAALVFFGATGITLNHPAWFGSEVQSVREFEGELPQAWVGSNAPETSGQPDTPTSSNGLLPQLAIVEAIRARHALRGAVGEFRVDDLECLILFRGPGYSADVVINRETARYRGTVTSLGLIAVINDLHKGRDAGAGWSLVIDIAALLTVFVSVTGIILILYIRRKRRAGLLTAVVGTLILFAAYLWMVP